MLRLMIDPAFLTAWRNRFPSVSVRVAVRAVFLCGMLAVFPHPAQAFQSYFINREVRAETLNLFPKWLDVLSRYKAESHTLDDICGSDDYTPCKLRAWKDFLTEQRGKSLSDQVEAVNRFVNKYPFVDDIVTWGIGDYWATPYEVQRVKAADCEDYSVAKFMSLRALGVSDEVMRVTIVKDLNLGGIIHAVLVIKMDDQSYVLDNQIKQVLLATKIYHYLPIYGINEHAWWQYFMPQ